MRKIGMRNLKTALSVFLCIVILKFFNIDYPFYACIAAVICMQGSIFDSFTTGKNRMVGTFIGALVGLLFALIEPRNPFLSAIGVMVVIYICNLIGKNKAITIGCVVFLGIMINLTDTTPLVYSTTRLLETFVGIAISVLVNYLVYPPKYFNKLYKMKENIITNLQDSLEEHLSSDLPINLSKLNKQISDFEDLLKSIISEITIKESKVPEIENLNSVLNLCKQAYSHLFMLESLSGGFSLNHKNIENLKNIINLEIENKPSLNSDMEIVYNYHIENIVKLISSLNTNLC
ncbi:fusaric acid resistance protein family protein [Clostridium homopropionicum DSM 5847]|uniref:Fusaric acid resistance protein family protein n=1 Tax=Clostridium homopropionicum DSM 5847 TaxID=1121318 RepID=A0A0L6ZA35_9CLOT|nr:aromatic acid exporter family protein [Clostridium homopropionicum]KOA19653.1 fusaric acid resistance protein family protein [Clostridium homopropionicum DSM 5847]SFF80842.1 Uncharacterized membrane protein YgaE, UPF0421/DUF939 family [Clostridium homopropionicum]